MLIANIGLCGKSQILPHILTFPSFKSVIKLPRLHPSYWRIVFRRNKGKFHTRNTRDVWIPKTWRIIYLVLVSHVLGFTPLFSFLFFFIFCKRRTFLALLIRFLDLTQFIFLQGRFQAINIMGITRVNNRKIFHFCFFFSANSHLKLGGFSRQKKPNVAMGHSKNSSINFMLIVSKFWKQSRVQVTRKPFLSSIRCRQKYISTYISWE